MRRRYSVYLFPHPERGFTLLEVMLGLTLGVLVLGGVMGSISASMNFSQRIKERSQTQPVLEAAAQEILAHPEKADQGSMTVGTFPSSPVVSIGLSDVIGTDGKVLRIGSGELYRVVLSYRGSILELSLIVPRSQFK
jgi:prepilin-type N-terminal cleavage/methylation domain-containing protein